MEHVKYELLEGDVAAITLSRGKANAMNLAMVEEMAESLERAEREARALLLSSDRPRFFSAGFDVTEVFSYDRPKLTGFLEAFSKFQQRLLHSPLPTVAALPGQTYAGGAILALSCDFRVMAEGDYGFALTEINIGVTLPPAIFHLLANAVGRPRARRMFLTGEPISTHEALQSGLVHELAPEAEIHTRAIAWARKLAQKPAETYAAIKTTILDSMGLARTDALVVDVEAWFTAEASDFKRRMQEKLAGK